MLGAENIGSMEGLKSYYGHLLFYMDDQEIFYSSMTTFTSKDLKQLVYVIIMIPIWTNLD